MPELHQDLERGAIGEQFWMNRPLEQPGGRNRAILKIGGTSLMFELRSRGGTRLVLRQARIAGRGRDPRVELETREGAAGGSEAFARHLSCAPDRIWRR